MTYSSLHPATAKDLPLQRYAGYPMLALNGSIRCLVAAAIAPLFYLCDDSFVRNRLPLLMQAVHSAQHLALSPRVIEALLKQAARVARGVGVPLRAGQSRRGGARNHG
ncbi:hypothetical protein OH686_09615 [Pseudomonas sp. SO81]|nr:hypothetical protein OH686_09615 [Pseudomonas sp. SO81]